MADHGRISMFSANALLLLSAAGLLIVSFVVSPGIGAMYLDGLLSEQAALLVHALVYYLPFMILPVLLRAGRVNAWDSMRLTGPISVPDMLYAAMAAIACLPAAVNITYLWTEALGWMGYVPPEEVQFIAETPAELLLEVFVVGVLPGIAEELLMRGALLSAWERRGSGKALIFSSLVFAAMHASVLGFPAELLLGLVIGGVTLLSGSLWTGMIFHTTYNAFVVMTEYVLYNAPSTSSLAYEIASAEGQAVNLLELLLDVALMLALALFFLYRISRRGRARGVERLSAARQSMETADVIVLISAIVTIAAIWVVEYFL